jgi:hypothetical protein
MNVLRNRLIGGARFLCAALTATAALAACAPTNDPQVTMSTSDYQIASPLFITHDLGGPLPEYETQYWTAAFATREVQIMGQCYSSCTIWLRSACVTPSATLGFHHARGIPPGHREWDSTTHWIASYYPPQIAQWFLSQARYSAAVVPMSGADAIRMGARACAI